MTAGELRRAPNFRAKGCHLLPIGPFYQAGAHPQVGVHVPQPLVRLKLVIADTEGQYLIFQSILPGDRGFLIGLAKKWTRQLIIRLQTHHDSGALGRSGAAAIEAGLPFLLNHQGKKGRLSTGIKLLAESGDPGIARFDAGDLEGGLPRLGGLPRCKVGSALRKPGAFNCFKKINDTHANAFRGVKCACELYSTLKRSPSLGKNRQTPQKP